MPRTRTGSIYKDKEGRIYARIQWIDEDGKQREVKRRARNRSEARDLIRDEIVLLDKGIHTSRRQRTFRQVAAEYSRIELVPALIVDGRKVAGKKHLATPLKMIRILVDYFGETPIQSITRPDIEEFRRKRFATPVERNGNQRTIRTVNYELAVLRQVFYFAESKHWLDRSPRDLFRKLILTSEETRRTRLLTPDEETRLLAACVGLRSHIRPLVIAALDTSLRRGALVTLTWSDIDFENRIIHVKRSETKNKSAAEIVGITRRLERELRELWRLSDKQGDTRVFGIDGDFKKAWSTALRKAKITDLRFHDLRGCAATAMIMAGIPEEIVRKATGHARAGILRDHYIRTNRDSIRRIADALDEARGENSSDLIN
jgi:integrase